MNKNNRFIVYENDNEFEYINRKLGINIEFNRIAFIFFVFFFISIIYSIHLIHLGTKKSDIFIKNQVKILSKSERADIIDRNGNYLAKTVSSIDIGINPIEIIDQKNYY